MEIGRLEALIETLDTVIAEKGAVTARSGTVRALVDLRLRASQRLAQWLDRFGMNPQARAGIRRQLAEGRLAAEIAQRRKDATGVVEPRRLPVIDAAALSSMPSPSAPTRKSGPPTGSRR